VYPLGSELEGIIHDVTTERAFPDGEACEETHEVEAVHVAVVGYVAPQRLTPAVFV